jgi:membrane fusion protein (multidrug efflux system)
LLDIVPVHNLWVVVNFKETQLEHIRPGQRVRITIDGYPSQTFEGVVDSFAPGSGSAFSLLPADNATGNFVRVVQRVPVKIRFASNPSPARLVPGLSARVKVNRGASLCPRSSSRQAAGRPRQEPRVLDQHHDPFDAQVA